MDNQNQNIIDYIMRMLEKMMNTIDIMLKNIIHIDIMKDA